MPVTIYIYALLIAALAIVYVEVLTAPGMVLAWLDKLLHRWTQKEWILKPLGDCAYCFGGQLCLWGYFAVMERYWWVEHILFVGVGIFAVHVWIKINDK